MKPAVKELSVIPRRLFLSALPSGERELSCFVLFGGQPDRLSWQCRSTDATRVDRLNGSRVLSDEERARGRVLVSVILPPALVADSLCVSLGPDEEAARVSWRIETYVQSKAFRLPLTGPVLVLGAHRIGDPHRTAWRIPSQQFAWDLLPLGNDGWRVLAGPTEQLRAASFAAFGSAVVAPAPGRVARATDGQPDQDAVGVLPSPETFRDNPTRAMGNYVVIDHGDGVWSFLGHLRRGSVCVHEGDEVLAGSIVASVGASGSAAGPHLHLHFMDGPDVLGSSPLPVDLDVEGSRYRPQAGELLSA